ncbi:MAG TPA: hypothetical protein VKS80_01865 [Trinickia sp.]|nr:hypothetical protein [Trinickia sp.]
MHAIRRASPARRIGSGLKQLASIPELWLVTALVLRSRLNNRKSGAK